MSHKRTTAASAIRPHPRKDYREQSASETPSQ